MEFDVAVIGKGPAGISAALYTQRANLKTAVLFSGDGALEKAEKIENYYGFPQGVSGGELLENGVLQAQSLGVTLLRTQVTGMQPMGTITLQTTAGAITAKAVLLATGKAKLRPKSPEVTSFEGRGVSYCAVCDGFFYRGKSVCVLGAGDYALSEAKELAHLAKVTLLTNGQPLEGEAPQGIFVETRKVQALFGKESLEGVLLEGGEALPAAGLFVAVGTASAAALARKVGIALQGDNIAVDGEMQTNIPGVFAAGDCTGGMLQVACAVSEGALAAKGIIAYVRAL